MHWKLKGTIQKSLSVLPYGMHCNHLLQRTMGALRNDDFVHHTFCEDVTVLFERMARVGIGPDSKVFEIGTGWLPVFPLSLALAGFRSIYTVDLYRHLREPLIRRTLEALRGYVHHPCFRPFATPEQVEARFQHLFKSPHLLTAGDITYIAPCDASQTALQPGSLDVIISNNVFEHVPQPVLINLFREAKRLLRPDGHILHCVNCGDHYAYSDPSITQINYLRFSDAEWARWNNSLQYQNRLRPIDFITMADGAGFEIRSAEHNPNERYLKALEQMKLAPEFQRYSLDQLAATSLTLIASA